MSATLQQPAPTNGEIAVPHKSAFQRRIDALTRDKMQALREGERLRAENFELRNELATAKRLLGEYRAELEKYRSQLIKLNVREHAGR